MGIARWLAVAWGPVKGCFATAGHCLLHVGSSVRERKERCCDKKQCQVWYMEQILDGGREGGETERAVVRTNGYRICGMFPHIILNFTIPHR